MFKVFLSHNSEDKPQVEVLAHLLRQESGVEPWLDAWNLIPGEPWQEAIEEALEDCAVCLCLIGRGDFGPWQHAEMRAAIAKRIQAKDRQFRVIPVLLPGASRGDRSKLPSFLVQTTWVEFRKSFEEEQNYHRLLSGIRGKAPGPGPSAAISLAAEDCPYPGLRFFDVDQAHLFFGRASVVEWLHRKLDPDSSGQLAFRFLAIMGPSGSGKSSLARAGLLASLKGGALVGSEAWPQVICFPGERPLENLALALSKAGIVAKGARAIQDFEAAMRQSPKALYLQGRLQPDDPETPSQKVLLIDQFEELFTLCKQEVHRQAFIDNLTYAATDSLSTWLILITLRADFFGKCAFHPQLSSLVSDHTFLVEPMNEEDLRQAILMPAQLGGYSLEPGLLDQMLIDTQDESGSLPLLQDTLQQLWKKRRSHTFSFAAYREMGGIGGALDQKATAFFRQLNSEQRQLCKQLFLRMVQPGEGTEDTKRRVSRKELIPYKAQAEEIEALLQALSGPENRLIRADSEEIEISHEALIRNWGLLRRWIDSERESLLIHRRLSLAVEEWEKAEQHPDYLYSGSRLAQVEDWKAAYPTLNQEEEEFIQESILHRDQKARKAKQLQGLVIGGLSILVLGLLMSLVNSNRLKNRSDQNKALALRALALNAYSQDSSQFNLTAYRLAEESFWVHLADEKVKQTTWHFSTYFAPSLPLEGHTDWIRGAVFSSDEQQVLTWSDDGTARIWEMDVEKLLQHWYEHYPECMCQPPDPKLKEQYGLEGLYYEKYCK